MHALVSRIKANLPYEHKHFTYASAVAFPRGVFSGYLPPAITRDQIFDKNIFRSNSSTLLQAAVQKAFDVVRYEHQKLSNNSMASITKALRGEYNIIPHLLQEIEIQGEMQEYRFSEIQNYVLDLLSEQKQAAVKGGAGTGKTLLALTKAQNLASLGKRTLLLCYTKRLAEWLASLIPKDLKENLIVYHYNKLVDKSCELAGKREKQKSDYNSNEKYFDEGQAINLEEACKLLPDASKFDALVVDEGRDFRELWWVSLESIFRCNQDQKFFYVFFDPNQDIFVDDWQLPEELKDHIYPLRENFRNSFDIAHHCAKLIGTTARSEIAPILQCNELEEFLMPNIKEAKEKAAKIVQTLCIKEGLNFSQVVILATEIFMFKGLEQQIDRVPITENIREWKNNEGVFLGTVQGFKGLEADAVVIICKSVDNIDSRYNLRINYVGRSRAKHILRVIELDYW